MSQSCHSYEGAARWTLEALQVPVRSPVQSPGGFRVAPPGPPPPGGSLPGIPPQHRQHHEGWRRSEVKYYPHLTYPRTRSMKREDRPWADCRVVCGIRKTLCDKRKNYKSSRSPDTYDLARGLALEGQSSSSSPALAEQSVGRVLPFLDPSASLVGEAFLFFPPPAGGEAFFLAFSESSDT